jgi:predicted DNA-binding transcriptional regulator YafY
MFEPEELTEVRRLAAVARLEGRAAAARVLEGLAAKLDALAGGAPGAGTLALVEEVLPAGGPAPAPAVAARVRRAVERQEPIRIRYRANRSGDVTTRRIRPFNVHFYDGQEYVEAFCELRGSDRIFALGNIEDVVDGEDGPAADA